MRGAVPVVASVAPASMILKSDPMSVKSPIAFLMRATHGKELGFAHMPLQPSTTYKMLHECLPRAFELANADGPDPELDLRGLAEPLWGHHSVRRGADTKARHTMHLTGATERDIDMLFGWNEHLYKSMMQLHYESNIQRDGRSKVTSMM